MTTKITPARLEQFNLFVKSDDFLLGTIQATRCTTQKIHAEMGFPHCWTSVDLTDTGWTLVHRPTTTYPKKGSILHLLMLTCEEYTTLQEEVYTEHEIAFLTKMRQDLNEVIQNMQVSLPEGHWDRALEIIEGHEQAMVQELKLMVKGNAELLLWHVAYLQDQL